MKIFFIPFLISLSLISAGVNGQDLNIALSGDANTEQSAKLELIRILNERLNKLTVAQLNSRVVVSSGVVNYYKVDEILAMQRGIFAYQSKYLTKSQQMVSGNAAFSDQYVMELKAAAKKATIIKDQLMVVVKSGQPITLPPMPTFSISPAKSSADAVGSFADQMKGILASYGVSNEADMNNLSPERRAAFDSAVNAAKSDFEKQFKEAADATTKQSLTLLGNVVGTMFGVPGAGTLIAGLASGGGAAAAISGLVGSIVDKFQIPTDYYDSNTLKLTDSERIKIIDELHVRISELYQQVAALGANISSETKTRYNELSQPRNDMIMYGPKK